MNKEKGAPEVQDLAPFQKRFIDEFEGADKENRLYRLDWPSGTGKTITATHIIKRLFTSKSTARVLVIFGHQVLQQSFFETIIPMEINAKVVDRYEYRMMQDYSAAGKSIWSQGTAYLLHQGFALQDDIIDSLSSVDWELLVTIASDEIFAEGSRLAERLVSCSPNLRILSESEARTSLPSIGGNPWTVAHLSWHEINDSVGNPPGSYTPPSVRIVNVEPTAAETQLGETVSSTINLLQRLNANTNAVARDFASRFESSPVAFEEAARRLRNYIAHGASAWSSADLELRDLGLHQIVSEKVSAGTSGLFLELMKYLRQIEELSVDSKIDALKLELKRELRTRSQKSYVCIYSSYVSTLRYIEASLDEEGFTSCLIVDNASVSDREQTIENFEEHGGVLLGSAPLLMESVDFSFVDTLVLYDVPGTSNMLNQLYGQFDRISRTKRLRLIAFDSENLVHFDNDDVVERIEKMIQGEG